MGVNPILLAAIMSAFRGSSIPLPLANITPDAEILPSAAYSNVGYFPLETNLVSYRGYAPHSVYFSGWDSTNFDYIVKYLWDFGAGTESDFGGRYFEGINAGHCFETPGDYTITLTITDFLGRTSSSTRTIKVYPGGSGYSSIRSYGTSDTIGVINGTVESASYALTTYYVDPTIGSDTYDGKSQTVDGGGVGPWQTFAKASAMLHKTSGSAVIDWPLKPGDKILFKRGDTHNMSGAIAEFGHGGMSQGIHIGAYGTGANPLLSWADEIGPNEASCIFDCRGFGHGFITMTDLDWQMLYGAYNVGTLWWSLESSRNITILRNTIHNPHNTTLQMASANSSNYLTNEPYGMFLLGCTADQHDVADTAVVLFAGGGANGTAIIGNTADHSGNHINYLYMPRGVIIADNTFSRPAFGRTALRITGGPPEAPAEKIHVTRNKFLGWIDPLTIGTAHNGGGTRYNYELTNLSHNSSEAVGQYQNDVVWERNIYTNFEGGLSLSDTKNLVHRNNLYVTPSPTISACIRFADGSAFIHRPLDNIKVYNNTFVYCGAVDNEDRKPFMRMYGTSGTGDYHTNVDIRNNLAISISSRTGGNNGDLLLDVVDNNSAQLANMVLDNNLLDSPYANWAVMAGTEYPLSTWQSTFGRDSASLKTAAGVVTPPTLTSHTPGTPDAAGVLTEVNAIVLALQLSSGSAALNTGADIRLYRDYLDNIRPIGPSLDIGAFERQV